MSTKLFIFLFLSSSFLELEAFFIPPQIKFQCLKYCTDSRTKAFQKRMTSSDEFNEETNIPDNLKAKFNNPNYDPLEDPEAEEFVATILPAEIRNWRKSLNDVIKAKTELDKELPSILQEDMDDFVKSFKIEDYLTSPKSDWVRNKFTDNETPFDESKLKELEAEIKQQYPNLNIGIEDN